MRVVIFSLIVILCVQCSPSNRNHEWPMYRGDALGSKYANLDQINVDNVMDLQLRWTYSSGDAREGNGSTIQCNPVMVDGLLYVTTPKLRLVALDAASGEERWTFDPYQGAEPSVVSRGVTHWEGPNGSRIYYGTGPHLYCLDAATVD